MTEAEIEKKWENTVWDTDIYLDDIDKLDEKKYKCGSAESCKYGDMCKPKYDIGGCSHYKEKRPQTNEEWLRSCDTEELVKMILDLCDDRPCFACGIGYCDDESWCHVYSDEAREFVREWLKQPHAGKE